MSIALIAALSLLLLIAGWWYYKFIWRAGRIIKRNRESIELVRRGFERHLMTHYSQHGLDEQSAATMAVAISSTVFRYQPTAPETITYLASNQGKILSEISCLSSDKEICGLLSGAIRLVDQLRWAHGLLSAENSTEGTEHLQKFGLYDEQAAFAAWMDSEGFHRKVLEFAERVDRKSKQVISDE